MRVKSRALTAGMGMLLAATVSGCSNADVSTPSASNKVTLPIPQSITTAQTEGKSPKIDQPLNLDRYRQNPCEALSRQQITDFLGSEIPAEPHLVFDCIWQKHDESQASIHVFFGTASIENLSNLKEKEYPFFKPLESIAGYPTVAYGKTNEYSMGRCSLATGTSDDAAFDTLVSLGKNFIGEKDPCAAAR